jgi:hypothetical protein
VGKVALLFERNKRTEREAMGYEVRNIQFRTQTDARGGYDFPMAPGHYRFMATSEDGRFARGEVDVPEGKTTELPIALQRGYGAARAGHRDLHNGANTGWSVRPPGWKHADER